MSSTSFRLGRVVPVMSLGLAACVIASLGAQAPAAAPAPAPAAPAPGKRGPAVAAVEPVAQALAYTVR